MTFRLFLFAFMAAAMARGAGRVSFPLAGSSGGSRGPSLSSDGRWVTFESTARLTRDDRNDRTDVYVYDRVVKTTRLVSDDRGGDQPAISANGRFVAYRAFDPGATRIRVRDLELGGPPVLASYPVDVSNYNRPAELPAISPNGRYVAYINRAAPDTYGSDLYSQNQIMVADTVLRTAVKVTRLPFFAGSYESRIAQIGRVAVSVDGSTVVFDTTDSLVPDDTNGSADIYLAKVTSDPSVVQRLSRATDSLSDLGGATQPVFTPDGTRAFYLAQNPLTAADTDGRLSIYTSTSADNFAEPVLVPTKIKPLRLAAQATVSGRFLAFLASPGSAFVHDLATGVDSRVVPEADAPLLPPVLSGDDRLVGFATAATNLAANDTNPGADVFVALAPRAGAVRVAPAVTLTGANRSMSQGQGVNLGAIATSASGPIRLLTIEVDGVEKARSAGGPVTAVNFMPARGIHEVQARAFDDGWIEGRSTVSTLTVLPPDGTLGITGLTALHRSDAFDGSASFDATLRLDNNADGAPTNPLRLVVTVTSTPQIMAQFAGDLGEVPDRGELILATFDLPALGAREFTTVSFSGVTPPTEAFGDRLQGNGWSVRARLLKVSGGNTTEADVATLLVTQPRLNENTDLPNTGIPVIGTPNDGNFNAGILQSITINGRSSVGERARTTFSATATFSNGSRPCVAKWSLAGANAALGSINAAGVFTARQVDAPAALTVQATFGGRTVTKTVTIVPVVPVVSVRAPVARADEAGTAGVFRFSRTPIAPTPLTIHYTVSGKATNGTDYAPMLSGTAVIPAQASRVSLDVNPQQDAIFEGLEDVKVTVDPDPAYRSSAFRTATVKIADDEPWPDLQPDLTLRRGRTTLGALVVDTDDDELAPALSLSARRGTPVTLITSVINRSANVHDYTLRGSGPALGFAVQYLDGTTDVTDAVVAGTFSIAQLAAGATHSLRVRITATANAPLGSSQLCVLTATGGAFPNLDIISAYVERVR
jgi:hypothetical protein